MWRHHMTGHLRGIYQGEVPVAWLQEQNLRSCNHCSSFVASSRSTSHQQKCSARPTGQEVSFAPDHSAQLSAISPEVGNTILPSLDEICSFRNPTIRFVPKRSKLAFARVLSSVLKEVIADNSVASWLKLMMLPKCILPSCKHRGRHNKPVPIESLCDLWMQDQLSDLWSKALSRASSTNKQVRFTETTSYISYFPGPRWVVQ